MLKNNLTTILLLVILGLILFVWIKDDKRYDLLDLTLDQDKRITELIEFRDELLTENAELKMERIQLNQLEHEVEMFYDSSYVDEHTPDAVKDSVLASFFRQYDSLVGRRVSEGNQRSDSTSRD